MESMWRRARVPLVFLASLLVAATLAAQETASPPAAPAALPGSPAPPRVVAEIQQAVDAAVRHLDAMDLGGVLALVSDQYRTGTLTKAGIGDQLRAVFAIHDQLRTRVRIDAVRMVGEHAWVYSTGEVVGRVRYLGSTVPVASWERELEVGRREGGRWRLYGYQQ